MKCSAGALWTLAQWPHSADEGLRDLRSHSWVAVESGLELKSLLLSFLKPLHCTEDSDKRRVGMAGRCHRVQLPGSLDSLELCVRIS